MASTDDPVCAALDAYIYSQLAKAAEAYTSYIDMKEKLQAVLEAGRSNDRQGNGGRE